MHSPWASHLSGDALRGCDGELGRLVLLPLLGMSPGWRFTRSSDSTPVCGIDDQLVMTPKGSSTLSLLFRGLLGLQRELFGLRPCVRLSQNKSPQLWEPSNSLGICWWDVRST